MAAYQRLDSAIAFLTKEKGVTHICVMGHSLGSRITTSYLAQHPVPALRGYIGVSALGGPPRCQEGDATDVRFADGRKALVSPTYRQVRIEDADHRFLKKEDEMVNVVVEWLRQQPDNMR